MYISAKQGPDFIPELIYVQKKHWSVNKSRRLKNRIWNGKVSSSLIGCRSSIDLIFGSFEVLTSTASAPNMSVKLQQEV